MMRTWLEDRANAGKKGDASLSLAAFNMGTNETRTWGCQVDAAPGIRREMKTELNMVMIGI